MSVLLAPDGRPLRFDPELDAPLLGPSVFAIAPSGGGQDACSMWRIFQPFKMLQFHGYPALWDFRRNIGADVRTASVASACELHLVVRAGAMGHERKQMARWFKQMRDAGRTVVYECDDDLFTPFMTDQQSRRVAGEAPPVARMEAERAASIWTLQRCDGATVTTQHLATTVRRFTDKRVEVVPNAIDAEWFRAVQALTKRTVPGPTIGWAGGHRPDADLTEMAVAWGRIAKRYPKVTFLLQGTQPAVVWQHVPATRIKALPWMSVYEYPQGLVDVDIGCCPLEDRPFNRCKSPIKAWEYALSDAAVVVSPTVYGRVVEHGRSGLVCQTADEWEEALSSLVEDEERRRAMADALAADVLAKWSMKKNYWRWPAAWRRLREGA